MSQTHISPCVRVCLQTLMRATAALLTGLSVMLGATPAASDTAAPRLQYIDGSRADMPIPRPGMAMRRGQIALVVTDPQNDFLSPTGVAWGAVGASVNRNDTVSNIERLLVAAKRHAVPVFISPHYYYPHDHRWKFEGALEKLMHAIGMFDRKGTLDISSLGGSGADWLTRYKPYIEDGATLVTSPHKVFGPESNDLVLQLRKAGISQVLLAGMSANLCVESHLRELLEQGFQVAVAADATAAAQFPGYDGYEAAFVNYRMLASEVWSTAEAVRHLSGIK